MPASPGCSARRKASSWLPRVVLGHDPVLDVGPVEGRHEHPRRLEPQASSDVGARLHGRRRGQRDPRHPGPPLAEHRERQVVGAEVVAPRRDAVRFVDREQSDRAAVQQLQGRGHAEPLGREVQQVQLAGDVRRLDRAALGEVLGGVQEGGPHPRGLQCVHLILHQRDQRGDDHPGAGTHERRDLVAERLPATGRHQHDRVVTGHQRVDDRALLAAERGVAEDPLEDLQCGRGDRGRCGAHGWHRARPALPLTTPSRPFLQPRLTRAVVAACRPPRPG